MLTLLDTGVHSAEENMRLDAELLDKLGPKDKPILHFYEWASPSATHGYFIQPGNHLDLKRGEALGLDLARRPTGGGIVFHIWDLAFSFLMPSDHPAFSLNTLENYRFVNRIVLDAMSSFLQKSLELTPQDAVAMGADCKNFCMAKPTQYDVVYQGMKIAGSAQRRRKQGYLHQGTISLAYPQIEFLEEVLLSKKEIVEAMQAYTFAPLGKVWEPKQLKEARGEIRKHIHDKLIERLADFEIR
ncbi:MAG: hypothetical protein A3E80_01210 [Chlamydiae bacterium RIFCSPHIGHO2_12_FULL_49_9]|nr:MAG: hypothetical protein A3E80_01210 [Chlamydiae bacterium RIFCSPHIGHO2_12_FULL_49_9]